VKSCDHDAHLALECQEDFITPPTNNDLDLFVSYEYLAFLLFFQIPNHTLRRPS